MSMKFHRAIVLLVMTAASFKAGGQVCVVANDADTGKDIEPDSCRT